ncbi:lysophospholipase [Proteiniclasticum sp. SCR006]|uniref:Lysophospholipase n=1 Tax=Proteiniclasticum aestuarii TaxID=2817862 RepID=A0A939KKA8_9CLOT|nr:alpha/beta hydrolase [Proteiniclasticum aestuarii]MBO1264540.1 lysophospholipase [Proteiniclasticum aestuarii]
MSYNKTMETFPSSNGLFDIHYYIYTPKKPVRFVLQITHGMCEYIERYEGFIKYLSREGVLVAGHDHAGHGRSIRTLDDLGYFSEDATDLTLVKDLKTMTDLLSERYAELPHFILGHSMGSFVLRKYLMRFGRSLSGIFISGTGGANPGVVPGITLAKSISAVRGEKHRSTLFNSIFFNGFNKNFQDEKNKFSWLTRDEKVVAAYHKDPKCNFVFTMNGFKGFLEIMKDVTSDEWAAQMPKEVPVHLFSGKNDPVGSYGKGVTETFNRLLDTEVKTVTMKLYEDGRHEMLNELNRKEVYQDLLMKIEEMVALNEIQ